MPNQDYPSRVIIGARLSGGPEIETLPMMPLRGMLVFPHVLTHLDVGRDRSLNAVNVSMDSEDSRIFLAMQREASIDEPTLDDIYDVGTVAVIRQMLKLPGGTVRLLVEGLYRARLTACLSMDPYMLAEIKPMPSVAGADPIEEEAAKRVLLDRFDAFVANSKAISSEAAGSITNISDPDILADTIAGQMTAEPAERQDLLEEVNVTERMKRLIDHIAKETQVLDMEKEIAGKVRTQMDKSQREYYLREQIKAIQTELGDGEDRAGEVEEYRKKAKAAKLPEHVMERFESELKKLEKTPPMMAEAMVITNYLDTILELPWNKSSEENTDVLEAERILNEDHYGLEKPKERILEYLASIQLKHNLKGPILCLVGPPGVGKTSLGRSIARATGREFVRMSLGGVHDEAEVRGHRRTYIGSMPGRILAGIKNCGVNNPLFLLDEVDKLGKDWRGDPTSALLEALDPEQNNTFSDHYLELPFDLSKVMFITTANVRSDIPRPLLDRMEVIDLSSYTEEEKYHIAVEHLIPKQLEEHGITKEQLKLTPAALRAVIRGYTREAGVRELERRIAKICRKVGRRIVSGQQPPFSVGVRQLPDYLGRRRYPDNPPEKEAKLGQVTGLAWTEVGGELLEIEVQTLPGKGNLILTGRLGDVMKESAQIGLSWLRSEGKRYHIPADLNETTDLHIHVPEGAVPKDGPSAGITIATALCSQLSGKLVRGDIAMTGEITLHGKVLPVGGIKEKFMAAYRYGVREIVMPDGNVPDLEDIPEAIRKEMVFHPVKEMREVLKIALV